MKFIYNQKLYDTDTARKIGEFNNGHEYGSDYYIEESLYRKEKGEFFLVAFGYGPSSEVIPLTDKEAREWMDEHCEDAEIYIELWGPVEE